MLVNLQHPTRFVVGQVGEFGNISQTSLETVPPEDALPPGDPEEEDVAPPSKPPEVEVPPQAGHIESSHDPSDSSAGVHEFESFVVQFSMQVPSVQPQAETQLKYEPHGPPQTLPDDHPDPKAPVAWEEQCDCKHWMHA